VNAEPVAERRRRVGGKRGMRAIGVAVAAVLLTSACAAGQRAQTAEQKASIDGVDTSVGEMQLLALALQPPSEAPYYAPGSDPAFRLVLVNTGTRTDTLTAITSSDATGWASYSNAADAYAVQVADLAAAKAKSSSSAPAGGSSAAAKPKGSQSVPIPPGSRVSYGVPEGKGELLLLQVKTKLYPATSIKLTFTFARAGSVSVFVPVQLSNSPGTAVVPAPSTSPALPG
jgi:hypothetical protein